MRALRNERRYLGIMFVMLLGLARPETNSSAEDWSQFRGSRGNGTAGSSVGPVVWGGVFDRPRWKVALPGKGWSSPVCWKDRIWLTSAETTASTEEVITRVLEENPHGSDDFQVAKSVSLFAIEIEATTGVIVRKILLSTIDNPPPIHTSNSYATPTSAICQAGCVCHFGSLGTFGIDIQNGEILWSHRIAIEDITGSGSSPIIYGELAYICCDGADEQFVVAIDVRTGEIRWKTPRPTIDAEKGNFKRAFSTGIVINDHAREQLVTTTAQWCVAYEPKTGMELWRARIGSGYSLIPMPAYRDGVVFLCSGYMKPELYAVRTDGVGDVSTTHVIWKSSRQIPEIASPIVVSDHIFCVSTLGVSSCIDAKTGSTIWQKRLPGTYSASPLAIGSQLYFTNQSGTTTILKANTHFELVATNELFGQTFATPAIIDGDLVIRTDPFLYRIGNASK